MLSILTVDQKSSWTLLSGPLSWSHCYRYRSSTTPCPHAKIMNNVIISLSLVIHRLPSQTNHCAMRWRRWRYSALMGTGKGHRRWRSSSPLRLSLWGAAFPSIELSTHHAAHIQWRHARPAPPRRHLHLPHQHSRCHHRHRRLEAIM